MFADVIFVSVESCQVQLVFLAISSFLLLSPLLSLAVPQRPEASNIASSGLSSFSPVPLQYHFLPGCNLVPNSLSMQLKNDENPAIVSRL